MVTSLRILGIDADNYKSVTATMREMRKPAPTRVTLWRQDAPCRLRECMRPYGRLLRAALAPLARPMLQLF